MLGRPPAVKVPAPMPRELPPETRDNQGCGSGTETHSRADAVALWACIAVGLLLRAAWQYAVPAETWGDTQRYDQVASFWAAGWPVWKPVTPLDLRSGLTYPLFLSILYSLFGHDLRIVVAIQHGLGLMLIPLTYALARQTFSMQVATLAAGLTAINPVLIRYEQRVYTETLSTFLLVLSLYCLTSCRRTCGFVRLALSGALLGLAALGRPSLQYFLVAGPIVLALGAVSSVGRIGWRRAALRLALGTLAFLVAATLVLTPWVVRNSYWYGYSGISAIQGQLIKKTSAFRSCMGNYPEIRQQLCAGSNLGDIFGAEGRRRQYTWLEYDRILREMAAEDISTHRAAYLQDSWGTARQMWRINDFGLALETYRKRPEYTINRVTWDKYPGSIADRHKGLFDRYVWPLVPLFMFSGIVAFVLLPFAISLTRLARGALISTTITDRVALALPIAYVTITGALASDTGHPRYRMVADPFTFIFAAAALLGACQLVKLGWLTVYQRSSSRGAIDQRAPDPSP